MFSVTLSGTHKKKKVLLRERKRHTAHRVASARFAGGGGGEGGVTPSSHGGWWGVPWVPPTIQIWPGVPPQPGIWDGVPPHHPDLARGIPQVPPTIQTCSGYPPHASVDRHTDSCQNITFPRTSYAGGHNIQIPCFSWAVVNPVWVQGNTYNDYLKAHRKHRKDNTPPLLHIIGYNLCKAWQACTVCRDDLIM